MSISSELVTRREWDVEFLRIIASSPRPFLYLFGGAQEVAGDVLNQWEIEARASNRGPNSATALNNPNVLASANVVLNPNDYDYLQAAGALGQIATGWIDQGRTAAGVQVVTADLRVHTDPTLARTNILHGIFTLRLP